MSCINPLELQIKDSFGHRLNIKTDCRHCLNCMIKRTMQIEFLTNKELNTVYRSGRSAAFVTLTYDDNHLPYNENGFLTLRRDHIRNWFKNIRRQMDYYNEKISFKVLYCGEYGDGSHSSSRSGASTHRPHYHVVFLGLGPEQVKKYTRKLWKFGLCDIGPLSSGGVRYLCKYMTKSMPDKDIKNLREIAKVENPFFFHSIGIGKQWIMENLDKIVEDEFTFNLFGKKQLYPSYIMKYVSYKTNTDYRPFVKKYLMENELNNSRARNITFSQYDFEKSYVKYIQLVQSLRSRNKPVNDITLSKHWAKPVHSIDRKLINNYVAEATRS